MRLLILFLFLLTQPALAEDKSPVELGKKYISNERRDVSSDIEKATRLFLLKSPKDKKTTSLRIYKGSLDANDTGDAFSLRVTPGAHLRVSLQADEEEATISAQLIDLASGNAIESVTTKGKVITELTTILETKKTALLLTNDGIPTGYRFGVVQTVAQKKGSIAKKVKLPKDFTFFKKIEKPKDNNYIPIFIAVLLIVFGLYFYRKKRRS